MDSSPIRHRLTLVAAALLFSTGGAAFKAITLNGWQVACFRSGIAAIVLAAAMPEARRGWSWRMAPVGLAYAATLVSYIRAYIEATQWCFDRQNRRTCLELLAKHNGISGAVAEQALDALLHPNRGLYPKAELNLPGINAAIELRAGMGFLRDPLPSAEKYIDLSYYRSAVGRV